MGTVTAAAMLCAGLAAVVALSPPPAVVRLSSLAAPARRPPDRQAEVRPAPASASTRTRAAASLSVVVAGYLMIGGPGGAVVGLALGVACWIGIGRLEPAAHRRDRERIVAAMPLAAELVAAALAAGCPPATAAAVAGAAVGGPLGHALTDGAAAAGMGVEPAKAWTRLAAEPASRPLARLLAAATSRGTAPAPALIRIAADARDAARWNGEARARSLGARAAAPLGLCFLPAFVLIGVVPIVATSGVLMP
ncbi:type II secretion system F family protein [Jiangella asiatica]|uniref:Type II secretion system F family protein n=1 Tax=Jiangella asiatica TaxID=2530372 RepID=A0A4R5C541_9ACTN|nr:type II secretion system F family protein [Jiangella asiatica]TDD94758.1 type II secretion system F family protein [Jiangella asiatica]